MKPCEDRTNHPHDPQYREEDGELVCATQCTGQEQQHAVGDLIRQKPGWSCGGCRCSTETPRARGKCPPAGLLGLQGQSCCWSLAALPGYCLLSGSGWPWHSSSPSSCSLQQGQCLSVYPSLVSAFSRTPQGQERVAAARAAAGGWCLGSLAGWQAFAVQNGLPVIGPGLQPASGGLQLQVLVVAGREEDVLPAGVQLGPCKARREGGALDNSSTRCRG